MKVVGLALMLTLSLLHLPSDGSSDVHRKKRSGDHEIFFPNEAHARESSCSTANGQRGTCKSLPQCIQLLSDISTYGKFTCLLGGNDRGICCPNVLRPLRPVLGLPRPPSGSEPPPNIAIPHIGRKDIEDAQAQGEKALAERDQLEAQLAERGLTIQQGTPEDLHQNFLKTVNTALLLGREHFRAEAAALKLQQKMKLTPTEALSLTQIGLSSTGLKTTCPPEPVCPATRYRSVDGSCNNLAHKEWGKSFTAFDRLLQPQYADGVSKPRVAQDGGPLPNSVTVSTRVIPNVVKNVHPDLTYLFIQYGQFLDNDLDLAPVYRGKNNAIIKCCDSEIRKNPSLYHPECFEIEVPPHNGYVKGTCMEFVRSLSTPRSTCSLGPREQMNQLTSFIDGSTIYGSSDDDLKYLRSFEGGRLREDLCKRSDYTLSRNFPSGKNRLEGEEQPEILEIVFHRFHNRLAGELRKLNYGWKDEQLFQEARRIVIAAIQHITYNEYLPTMLGLNTMQTYKLFPKAKGFSDDYNSSINPSILNEFSVAAFRLYTLVQGLEELYHGQDLPLIRKPTSQNCRDFDNFILRELTNHLLQGNSKAAIELASLTIQRGRDHGIRPYNDYRKFCGLSQVNTFNELDHYLVSGAAAKLKSLYRYVKDVDLWIAGFYERPLPGAVVGPTFACILGEQFKRTKLGDRFWYENGHKESSFSQGQLEEIRKISLARILCDNGDNIKYSQPLVLLKPKEWNKKVSCSSSSIPFLNLQKWKNEPIWSK